VAPKSKARNDNADQDPECLGPPPGFDHGMVSSADSRGGDSKA
jgi:hypothetical protein